MEIAISSGVSSNENSTLQHSAEIASTSITSSRISSCSLYTVERAQDSELVSNGHEREAQTQQSTQEIDKDRDSMILLLLRLYTGIIL